MKRRTEERGGEVGVLVCRGRRAKAERLNGIENGMMMNVTGCKVAEL